MKVEKDYEDILRLFNKFRVKYCIVGAFAVAFYALPRYTKDMDILIEPSKSNSKRVIKALIEFGFKGLGLKDEYFTQPNQIIQLGYEPVRIDIITSISGCEFNEVWKNRKKGKYGNVLVNFIGLNELIKNKEASSRKQDEIDLEILKKVSHIQD